MRRAESVFRCHGSLRHARREIGQHRSDHFIGCAKIVMILAIAWRVARCSVHDGLRHIVGVSVPPQMFERYTAGMAAPAGMTTLHPLGLWTLPTRQNVGMSPY